jgi:hypothetical protein
VPTRRPASRASAEVCTEYQGWSHPIGHTIYGRQETWEDSPAGWPQRWGLTGGENVRSNGRPTAQWSRLEAGRSDNLGTAER